MPLSDRHREHLELGPKTWTLRQQLALLRKGGEADWEGGPGKTATGRLADLRGAEVKVVAYVNDEPRTQLVLREGALPARQQPRPPTPRSRLPRRNACLPDSVQLHPTRAAARTMPHRHTPPPSQIRTHAPPSGVNSYVFGEGLDPLEQEYIAQSINTQLQEARGEVLDLEAQSLEEQAGLLADSRAARALPPPGFDDDDEEYL